MTLKGFQKMKRLQKSAKPWVKSETYLTYLWEKVMLRKSKKWFLGICWDFNRNT